MSLLITDLGSHRRVQMHGRVFFDGRWHADGAEFTSPYRKETLEALYEAKHEYLLDEIKRVEDPGYLYEQFIGFASKVTSLAGARVLDFGSGCGSSSILLAREGALVSSVELMPTFRRAARLRVEDERQTSRIQIVETDDMFHLPFDGEVFDVITLNAVVEHMKPQDRETLLRALWRHLKIGGVLVITETPNRLYPYDSHTTRLPLVSWLPLGSACALARVGRPEEFRNKSESALIYDGIVGSTWWRVRNMLPEDAKPVVLSPHEEGKWYFRRLRLRKRGLSRVLVEALAVSFSVFAALLHRITRRVPLGAFFPYLNIAFKKI